MSGEGTIILELCSSEVQELVQLLTAQLTRLDVAKETQAGKRETVILGSLSVKLFNAVLPMALRELLEETDR